MTHSCDCCTRDELEADEIAEHTQDRDTPWGYMAVPTECIYCRDERLRAWGVIRWMHLERHTSDIQVAAISPTGLTRLPQIQVEVLVLVRDDGPHVLSPAPPVCSCRRHASPN